MQSPADAAIASPSPDITPPAVLVSRPLRLGPSRDCRRAAISQRSLKFTFRPSVTVATTATGC